jgi:hypothetical protein
MTDRQRDSKRSENVSTASAIAESVLPTEVIRCFSDLVREAETLAFITRDRDLQQEGCRHLEAFLGHLDAEKKRFVAVANEDAANACLAVQCMVRSLLSELRMWLALKAGDYEGAWNLLIDAQDSVIAATQAHPCGAIAANRLPHYGAIEENVFPPQVFCSVGFVIEAQDCSICGEPYEDCTHIGGWVYMGEFCAQVIKKACLLEAGIVEVPADKRCRVMYVSDSGGRRNRMTWKVEPGVEDSEEQ